MSAKDIFSPEEAQRRLKLLPPDVRDLIYSSEMARTIENIGKKYNLHVDTIGTLESQTTFLMLGFIDPNEFAGVLEERLPTDTVTAGKLVQDINEQMLNRIRSSLKQIYPDAAAPSIISAPTATPAQSTTPLAERLAQAPEPIIPGVPQIPAPMAPASTPPLSSVQVALTAPQITPQENIDVAPRTSPPSYSKDPYREEIE